MFSKGQIDMLQVSLKRNYGSFQIDCDFKTQADVTGILGASASGKSQTLKMIAGVVKPHGGEIILKDRILYSSERGINLSPQDRRVGLMFQDFALFPNMTVAENLKVGQRMADSPELEKIMDILDLGKIAGLKPRALSGGQKQRLALGRIILNEPEIILLDEPFSSLDDYLKWKIELEIFDYLKDLDIPIVFVSHNRGEVFRNCEKIVVMKDGKSEEIQKSDEIFYNPQTMAAALISGCKNFSPIKRLGEKRVLAKAWGLEFTTDEPVSDKVDTLGIRSHFFKVIDDDSGVNTYDYKIDKKIEDLFEDIYILDTKGEKIRIELRKDQAVKSDVIRLQVLPEDVFLLSSEDGEEGGIE